ncbi:MAG: MFS transporter [Hyphomonadaceae bacterium]
MTAPENARAGAPRTAPYAWVVLGMLAFIYVFNFLDRQLMSTVIESIKRDTGFTDAEMGYMTGFWFALVYTTFGVVVGFFADRTSRRNVLFCGAVLWSAFTAMCGMATNYWMMLAARVGVGVGEAAGAPPSYSIISDYFPAEKRGAALAIFSLGVPFGQALAVAFGSQIDIIWGWRAAFIGIGIAGIFAAILMYFVVREPRRGAVDPPHLAAIAHETSGFGETFWEFVNRPVLLFTALSCGLSAFVGYAALNWNAPFLLRVQGMTREELSIWYALMLAIALGLGTWLSGAMVDWLAKRSRVWYAMLPALTFAIATPFWYFATQAASWQAALAILSVPTFLTIFYLAPGIALVNNSVKPSQRTMSSAILLMVLNFIGLGGGPTLVGALSTSFTASKLEAGLGVTPEQVGAYLKMTAAEAKTLPENVQTAIVAAGAGGLRDALAWMTPFYLVAIFFLLLQALAVSRELKAGAPIRDGGARLGIVLFVVGAVGLVANLVMRGPAAMVSISDVLSMTQGLMLLIATLAGTFLCFKAIRSRSSVDAL